MASAQAFRVPTWAPEGTRDYIAHVEGGLPIRAIARATGRAPSTVLRRIRRFEGRRDDPLIDEALSILGRGSSKPESPMTEPDADTLEREALRVLRRLAEPGAVLAMARGMDVAAVMRGSVGGEPRRTATLPRSVARAMALKEWIGSRDPSAPLALYRLTSAGHVALRRLITEDRGGKQGDGDSDGHRQPRYSVETPISVLGRRRDRKGAPFLAAGLLAAGERLREDYELARAGGDIPSVEALLAEGGGKLISGGGPEAARTRLRAAFERLGPGLSDVLYSTCCRLDGIEATEQRLGWAARSGKEVLRIALRHLRLHYDETEGRYGAMIG